MSDYPKRWQIKRCHVVPEFWIHLSVVGLSSKECTVLHPSFASSDLLGQILKHVWVTCTSYKIVGKMYSVKWIMLSNRWWGKTVFGKTYLVPRTSSDNVGEIYHIKPSMPKQVLDKNHRGISPHILVSHYYERCIPSEYCNHPSDDKWWHEIKRITYENHLIK